MAEFQSSALVVTHPGASDFTLQATAPNVLTLQSAMKLIGQQLEM
jgi:hypothetical protein